MFPPQLQYTFELMEVSFLVNKDGHLHLLNVVSGTTCTEVRGGARFRDVILPRMLEEILQLCIDPIYALNGEGLSEDLSRDTHPHPAPPHACSAEMHTSCSARSALGRSGEKEELVQDRTYGAEEDVPDIQVSDWVYEQ